eukprot:6192451-Pleurochrysis_carterae.AAC.3
MSIYIGKVQCLPALLTKYAVPNSKSSPVMRIEIPSAPRLCILRRRPEPASFLGRVELNARRKGTRASRSYSYATVCQAAHMARMHGVGG